MNDDNSMADVGPHLTRDQAIRLVGVEEIEASQDAVRARIPKYTEPTGEEVADANAFIADFEQAVWELRQQKKDEIA